MEDYAAILKGDYSRLPRKQSNTVRIFLSSTFGGECSMIVNGWWEGLVDVQERCWYSLYYVRLGWQELESKRS